jgi:predicted NBD/HSP70 family sugar kinase
MYLGIDIGGTSIKYGIIDDSSKLIFKNKIKTDVKKTTDDVIDTIVDIITSVKTDYPKVLSVGVGLPCVVLIDNKTKLEQIKLAPNLPA